MRSFRQHKLMVEFVENLFEFNLEDRKPGSLGTWSSTGWPVSQDWITDGLAKHGITLDQNSIFKVVAAPAGQSITIGGGTVEDVKAWTELSDGPEGKVIATIGWTKIAPKLFKQLKMGKNIVWGSNTNALETAQCLGVYLEVDDALAEYKADNAQGRKDWIPKIETVFANGQDWNSAGVATLKAKMPEMPDDNFLELLLLAKGVKNFVDKYGTKLGTNLHIIHGSIGKYYKAEETNFGLGNKGKANTADFILANASATEVIDAVATQTIKFKDESRGDYAYTDDATESIKFYQISLKMAHGQLGKVTDTMKAKYFPGRSSTDLYRSMMGDNWDPIVKNYLTEQGYELDEGLLSWATDVVSQGIAAIKAVSMDWYEKIAGYVNKFKDWALGLSKSFDSGMPSGKNPTAYQISLLNKVLVEDGRLKHGQLLNEAKIDCDGINECLKTTNQEGAQKIVKETNMGIADIQGMFYGKDLLAFAGEGFISESSYTQKGKKKSWKFGDIIKIFANATAIDAFNSMMKKHKDGDLSEIVKEQIDLAREIYFGKTQLPLFKVYGAKDDTDTGTVERLGTAAEWVSGKLGALTGDTLGNWPVIGFHSSLQKGMYYNISGGLIAGTNSDGSEPSYILLAMRTNRADAFSFVAEGSGKLNLTKFKKKFGLDY